MERIIRLMIWLALVTQYNEVEHVKYIVMYFTCSTTLYWVTQWNMYGTCTIYAQCIQYVYLYMQYVQCIQYVYLYMQYVQWMHYVLCCCIEETLLSTFQKFWSIRLEIYGNTSGHVFQLLVVVSRWWISDSKDAVQSVDYKKLYLY